MERKIIYLDDAIDALRYAQHRFTVADEAGGMGTVKWSEDVIYFATAERVLAELPSAQPEPLSDAYMKAVWTWLLDYQINVAKLKGRYTPYEVLSWVANDWRKEHE